jgi:transposase
MNETLENFYSHLLGVESPWEVSSIKRDSKLREVTAIINYKQALGYFCPECNMPAKLHDHRTRIWRHLDSCNHKTLIEGHIPRVDCETHGVKQIPVSWAESNSRFTLEFEQAVIVWLKVACISSVAEYFTISWDQIDGIQNRAVKRGLARRRTIETKHIGIDETSYQKHHQYVTVILDKEHDVIIDILDDRKAETLKTWLKTQEIADFTKVESITMDMWDPFINAIRSKFEEADNLIAFDRFHVSQHFNKAVDKVRSAEHRAFLEMDGYSMLTHTKYQWLRNSENSDNRSAVRREFMPLTRLKIKTARAWSIKEVAAMIWDYTNMGCAEKAWKRLLNWISHCRLDPMIAVGKMVREYFWGILNAIRLKTNNSMLEAKNALIQKIKNRACGFRNRERFRNAILFHLGGLDMLPCATR